MPRPPQPANDPRLRVSTWRKTLRPADMANEVAAKGAEERIVAAVPARVRSVVRAMLRGLRRRRFG